MIEITGGAIGFTHPLLATAVYTRSTPTARRALHLHLSGIVDDVEERARHLALGSVTCDEHIATTLERAADHARRRGAPDAAADLLEHAFALGDTDPERRVRAAEDNFQAGNTDRAPELLEATVADLGPGALRARALAQLGFLRSHIDAPPEATALMEQAIAEASDDPHLRASVAMKLCHTLFIANRAGDCPPHTTAAVDDAERSGDRALLAEALATRESVSFFLGTGCDESALARALALEDPDRPTPVQFQPSMVAGLVYRCTHRLDEAQTVLTTVRRRRVARGAVTDLPIVESYLVQTACAAGDIATAAEVAADYVTRFSRVDAGRSAFGDTIAAEFLAWVGRVDEARTAAEGALQRIDNRAAPMLSVFAVGPLSLAALSTGDHETVVRLAYPVVRAAKESGYGEPAAVPAVDDSIEALVMAGRLDDAEPLVEWLETSGRQPGRWWADAVGARCRAVLGAARGELDEADAAFAHALSAHDNVPQVRYDRARTLLAASRFERRRGRRRAAQPMLTEAADLFDQVGTARWAASARAELGRLGLGPTGDDTLTATEEQVAELAASGMTNREIAAAVLVSAKTVEAHLGRIYRKLGIRNRAQLGRLRAEQTPP